MHLGGRWDYELMPVYVVSILDFVMEMHRQKKKTDVDEGKEAVSYYVFREVRTDELLTDALEMVFREVRTDELLTDALEMVFIELPLFGKREDQLETDIDRWIYSLKNMAGLDRRPEELSAETFIDLFSAAEIAGYTKEEQEQYIGYHENRTGFHQPAGICCRKRS